MVWLLVAVLLLVQRLALTPVLQLLLVLQRLLLIPVLPRLLLIPVQMTLLQASSPIKPLVQLPQQTVVVAAPEAAADQQSEGVVPL